MTPSTLHPPPTTRQPPQSDDSYKYAVARVPSTFYTTFFIITSYVGHVNPAALEGGVTDAGPRSRLGLDASSFARFYLPLDVRRESERRRRRSSTVR